MNTIIDNNLSIEVVRTKRRKTASIKILNGFVQAIVPDQISDFKVKELIKKRRSWIRKKLEEQSKRITPSPKEYISGESFTYLGKNYRLKLVSGIKSDVKLMGGYLEVSHPKKINNNKIRDLLVEWYVNHASERLIKKTNRYAKIIGVSPISISVKDYKSRWGSCSTNGDISYNWRIIIAPHHVVDYVVVHELCHLLEHNHSKEYWRHVSNNFQSYKECRNWLKMNGLTLVI